MHDINSIFSSDIESFLSNFYRFLTSQLRTNYVISARGNISLYLRKGQHFIEGNIEKTLDIANIEINPKGCGIGGQIIKHLEEINLFPIIFVENVLTDRFYQWLQSNDYQNANKYYKASDLISPSVYKRTIAL